MTTRTLIVLILLLPASVAAQVPKQQESPAHSVQQTIPVQTMIEGAPKIQLIASLYTGDVGEDWRSDIVFSDYSIGITFRWQYEGPKIEHAEYQVYDKDGNLVESKPLSTGDPGSISTFSIPLSNLPERSAYHVRVRPTNAEGSSIYISSNPVLLTYQEAQPVPFLFAQFAVEDFQRQWSVPALTGSVSCAASSPHVYVAGVRRATSSVKSQRGDSWHIGSDTKAMTTTMIGKLVEEGQIAWSDTLWNLTHGPRNLFPELKGWPSSGIHPRFQNVTIEHLASHRSGMVMHPHEDALTRKLSNYNREPMAFRWEMVLNLLSRDHSGIIGEWRYGHGNYLVLASIIERIKGRPYEQVMKEELFAPAGMTTARFGMPIDLALDPPPALDKGPNETNSFYNYAVRANTVDTTSYTNGHVDEGDAVVDNLPLPPIWNPAGGAFLSMDDWQKFLRIHIHGRSGTFSLQQTTLDKLHSSYSRTDRRQGPYNEPEDEQEDPTYGWGWGIGMDGSSGRVLMHDGTYGRFYATAAVYLDEQFAVISAANMAPDRGRDATWAMRNWLVGHAKQHCGPAKIKLPNFKINPANQDSEASSVDAAPGRSTDRLPRPSAGRTLLRSDRPNIRTAPPAPISKPSDLEEMLPETAWPLPSKPAPEVIRRGGGG